MARRVPLDVDGLHRAGYELGIRRERDDLGGDGLDHRRVLVVSGHRLPLRLGQMNRRVREVECALGIHETTDVIAMAVRDEDVGDALRIDARFGEGLQQQAGARSEEGSRAGVEQQHTILCFHQQRLDREREFVGR
jgi:hypothetical protein